MLSETDQDRDQRTLAEWIGRKGRPVTPRDLQMGLRQFRRSAELAEEALNDLVSAGYGRWSERPPGAKGGRPTRAFELSVGVNANETPADSKEKAGSVDVDGAGGPDNSVRVNNLLAEAAGEESDDWGVI